jgi:hypothetical protein
MAALRQIIMALLAVERVRLSKRAHLWQINQLVLFKHLLRVTRLQVRELPIPAIRLATSLPVTVLQLILGRPLIRDLLQITQDRLTTAEVRGKLPLLHLKANLPVRVKRLRRRKDGPK